MNGKDVVPLYYFLLGAVSYWAAIPPLSFWPLAFLVPVFWTVVVEHPEKLRFRTVYLGALIFWLASIWWIACPHPATAVGLLALSAYLAVYWPLFFSASRMAVHRLRIPAVLAVPVCWIGCEYLRNHMLGGFSFCSLEHALYLKPVFIQIADISGGYLVGGMLMLVGTGVAALLTGAMRSTPAPESEKPTSERKLPAGSLASVLAMTVLAATVWYGVMQQKRLDLDKGRNLVVAVCQGNIPVKLDADVERQVETYRQFIDLTGKAVKDGQDRGEPVDLVIWPETVCPVPYLLAEDPTDFEKGGWDNELVDYWNGEFAMLKNFIRDLDTPVLVGLSTLVFQGGTEPARLNSALLIDPKAESIGPRYDKVHLVMFGEYVPFSKYLPEKFFIKTLCQEAGRGTGPVAMPTRWADGWFSVNICFESTIPHLVRNQVLTLKEQGREPAFLVNMSNDGWFLFSQQIDQHLATHVFRAVENRRPYISATNGGFSAVIDGQGRVRELGSRRGAEAVAETISMTRHRTSIYHRIGDAIPLSCTVILAVLLFCRAFSEMRPSGELRPVVADEDVKNRSVP